jgi:hypothetical protein
MSGHRLSMPANTFKNTLKKHVMNAAMLVFPHPEGSIRTTRFVHPSGMNDFPSSP